MSFNPCDPRKYRLNAGPMTKEMAKKIRCAHLQGKPVLALELQEAVRVLAIKPEPKKLKLPDLSRPERERVNAILAYNLGRALGRIEERKAA
jgi:hypothetical protein